MNLDPKRRTLLGGVTALALASISRLAVSQPQERTIAVVARKFEYVPRQIVVKKGETVVLEFTAPEVVMGFNLNAFGVRTDIVPGQPARVRLTPDKTGEFVFYCDVFCGSGHEEMDGTLSVTE